MELTRTPTTAAELRAHLGVLELERTESAFHGLAGNALYMADLRQEIEHTRAAYVGQAVTEIASLRGQLGGPLRG